jgi:predicted membrane protein
MRMNGRVSWGIVLIVVGILFLLDSGGVLDVGNLVSSYWPVLLILWGAWLLLRKDRDEQKTVVSGPLADVGIGRRVEEMSADRVNLGNVFGDVRCRALSKAFTGGSLSSVFGDVEIDLTAGDFAAGEHNVKMDTVLGDIVVALPAGVAFAVAGDSVLGKVSANTEKRNGFFPSLEYASPGFKNAPVRVRIDASTVLGEVSVQQKLG